MAPLGLTNPFGIAVDGAGNVYVSDSGHSRIVRFAPKSGGYDVPVNVPFSGLSNPTHVAVDEDGAVYVADTGNLRVLRLPRVGNGYGVQETLPFGPLAGPQGVVVDDGDVLVVDASFLAEATVRRLPRAGSGYGAPETLPFTGISTVAGAAGIAVDDSGDVYVGTSGFSTGGVAKLPRLPDGGWGSLENLTIPGARSIRGVAVTSNGSVIAADPFTNTVFDLSGPAPTPLPLPGVAFPNAVAVRGSDVFVAGGVAGRVFRLPTAPDGYGTVTELPRVGISEPGGLAIAPGGRLIVGDVAADDVVRLPSVGTSDDRGDPVVTTAVDAPAGIALDVDGSVFVASSSNATPGSQALVKVPMTPTGYGTPVAIPVGASTASDVALDADGNLVVAAGSFSQSKVVRLARNADGGFGAPEVLPFGPVGFVSGVAIGPTGDVFATWGEGFGGQVARLPRTADGWGAPATVPFAPLGGPVDVTVDGDGAVYVLDNSPPGAAGALVYRLAPDGGGWSAPAIVPFAPFDRGRSIEVRPSGTVVATVQDSAGNASLIESAGDAALVQGAPLRATVREGEPYQGRLTFLNATGDVTVEQTDGATLVVDADGDITAPGTLGAGTYAAAGIATDAAGASGEWAFELEVESAPAAVPVQVAPFSDRVYAGTPYTGQLAATNATGDLRFRVVDGNGAGVIGVSPTGAISSGSTRPPGTYVVRGTMSDETGATGTWTFTLEILDAVVCRTGAAFYPTPPGTVITAYLVTQGCGTVGANNANSVRVALPVDGIVACQAPFASATGRPYFAIPEGYVVTAYRSTPGCATPADSFSSHRGANSVRLSIPRDGTVVCQIQSSVLGTPEFAIPAGYVVTAYPATPGCGAGGSEFSTFPNRNSARISVPKDGIVACQRGNGWGYRTPEDYVVTAYLATANCGRVESPFSTLRNTNSAQIRRPFDGVVVCQLHSSAAGNPWYRVPTGYRRVERLATRNCGAVASFWSDSPNTNSIRVRPS